MSQTARNVSDPAGITRQHHIDDDIDTVVEAVRGFFAEVRKDRTLPAGLRVAATTAQLALGGVEVER